MQHLPIHAPEYKKLHREYEQLLHTLGYKGKNHLSSCVREFLFFIEEKGIIKIASVKASHIVAYYDYLRERPNQRRMGGLSDSSIRSHLYALRLFFDYLLDTAQLSASPARLPKFSIVKYNERSVATIEEIRQLYAVCGKSQTVMSDRHTNGVIIIPEKCRQLFDKALLGLAYGCGLRRSEIALLNASDIDFHKGILTVRQGKFGKTRTVPISDHALGDLKNYLIQERSRRLMMTKIPSPAFLLSEKGKRMYAPFLNDRIKELVQATGNSLLAQKSITIHCLRHSIATHLLDKGASIEFVQQFLGHQLLDTTHIYSRKRKQKRMLLEALYHEKLNTITEKHHYA